MLFFYCWVEVFYVKVHEAFAILVVELFEPIYYFARIFLLPKHGFVSYDRDVFLLASDELLLQGNGVMQHK